MYSVFFDLDGTLFDTLGDIKAAINYALRAYDGTEASDGDVRRYVGRGLRRALSQAVVEHCPPLPDENEFELMMALMMSYYRNHPSVHTRPYPGIPDLLSELERRGIRTGVVSNKADELVQEIVRESGLHFDFISGQRTDFPLKPDPSLLLHGISDVGSDSSHTVYVGDSEVDAETGRRACVETVIVSYGFRTKEELGASGILKTVENPSELGALLSAHFKSAW